MYMGLSCYVCYTGKEPFIHHYVSFLILTELTYVDKLSPKL